MSHNAIICNSPALHSLKREQLVKLCKMHSLKVNGKKIELIDRLKQRALELPPDAVNYRWDDSDDDEDMDVENDLIPPDPFRAGPPRPSEQWEMVMDNIEEVDENGIGAVGTMSSIRTVNGNASEFGTGGSKSSVKSSLKAAFANSFGMKRAASSKSTTSTLASDVNDKKATNTEPTNDPFAFPSSPEPEVEPIPGTSARPGAPAPANARLSTGSGITTTIRLISSSAAAQASRMLPTPPRMKPFKPTYDLQMGSPEAGVWPPPTPVSKTQHDKNESKAGPGKLYPAIPFDELIPSPTMQRFTPAKTTVPAVTLSMATPAKSPYSREMPSNVPDDVFSPTKPTQATAPKSEQRKEARLSMPQAQPFMFGSPLPQPRLSNAQFGDAAASVLEEMNKRLAEAGVPKVEKTVLDIGATSGLSKMSADHRVDSATSDRFAKAHDEAFKKMDSIANHYAARRPLPQPPTASGPTTKKRKSDALGLGHGPHPNAKRKSSAAGTRVISNGVRKKMGIPGGFGDDTAESDSDANSNEGEEKEDPATRRSSKRIRIATDEGTDVHKGRRPSLLPSNKQTHEEIRKQEREREAVRRHLDARRRSSRGRASLAGKNAVQAKSKGRFGFLSSAKSLVRNVWNMGAYGGKAAAPPASTSNIPVAKPKLVEKKVEPAPKPAPAPPANSTKNSRSSLLKPNSSLKATSTSSTSINSNGVPSSRARSPIPSFAPPPSSSTLPLTSRTSAALGNTAPLNIKARPSSMIDKRANAPAKPGVSSLGARTSVAAAPASSLGVARSSSRLDDASSGTESGKPAGPLRKRTISSNFMAPTASSLARQRIPSNLASVGEHPGTKLPMSPSMLRQITNSPADGSVAPLKTRSPLSPARQNSKPQSVFSQPLTKDAFGGSPLTATRKISSSLSSKRGPMMPTKDDENSQTMPAPRSLGSVATTLLGPNNTASGAPARSTSNPRVKGPLISNTSRKPRISRSRVIAKLGQQRAAAVAASSSSNHQSSTGGRTSLGGARRAAKGRTRSSMGAAPRRSLGVGLGGKSNADRDMLMSAKKKARQSEYLRRRSRVTMGGGSMDVDA